MKRRKIVHRLTGVIRQAAEVMTGEIHNNLYITNTRRGRCGDNDLTVPLWAYDDEREGYFIYYLAHELAHKYNRMDKGTRGHSKPFYNWFKVLCPVEFQHYETEYKPRLAANSGIRGK
jgi:hypothetical protein